MLETLGYIVLAIIGFFIFMQLYIWISSYLKKGKSIPEFGGELGDRVKKGEKLLIYFYSNSCAACRPMTPVIDKMKDKRNDVFKVNLSRDFEIGKIFGVMGTPATLLIENSTINQFVLGTKSEQFLRNLIEN
jgi:thioredoxin 1